MWVFAEISIINTKKLGKYIAYKNKVVYLQRESKTKYLTILIHTIMRKKATYTFVEDESRTVTAIDQNVIDTTSAMVNAYQVGKMYRYFNHTFAIWGAGKMKNDETGKKSNHVTFIVTFDGNTAQKHYLDSEGIKQKIGDERRAPRDGSVNNTENGEAKPIADLDVCTKKANNAYKAELAAIATLQKRFGARIVSDVAELCELCVSNTAQTMYAAAKEKERKALAAKKETKEFAANVASNKATIDEIKAALAAEKAKDQPDTIKILELTNKLLELL